MLLLLFVCLCASINQTAFDPNSSHSIQPLPRYVYEPFELHQLATLDNLRSTVVSEIQWLDSATYPLLFPFRPSTSTPSRPLTKTSLTVLLTKSCQRRRASKNPGARRWTVTLAYRVHWGMTVCLTLRTSTFVVAKGPEPTRRIFLQRRPHHLQPPRQKSRSREGLPEYGIVLQWRM